ncbi:hypothetical protein [Nocardioides albus]|uniref:Uncharacterized protein YukE n=1 Tax=Nocardioides albus TaxID=1841 RepID=A0A7W5FB06_9ACTN|nr:hypothetical protein [Nocardioides albus]MBB3091720.1 uncharacterized protein YukE [Nocardioides albus]GGU44387.1 hypothetical protein GCM10007979_49310 [Nocardioides albus]
MGAEVTLEADEQALLELSTMLEGTAAELRTFFDRIAEDVTALIAGWQTTGEDQSRQAHDQAQSALVAAGGRSADALDKIAQAVASYAEKVHDTEVRNVAAIG